MIEDGDGSFFAECTFTEHDHAKFEPFRFHECGLASGFVDAACQTVENVGYVLFLVARWGGVAFPEGGEEL